MNDTKTLPDSVDISEARSNVVDKSKIRSPGVKYKVAEEIVRLAFGGEIPNKRGTEALRYTAFDENASRKTRLKGVKIKTKREPHGYKDFYRGTRADHGTGRGGKSLDAEKIREKWEEVRKHAVKTKNRKRAIEARREKELRKTKENRESLSSVREKLGLTETWHERFTLGNGKTGKMKIHERGVSFEINDLTAHEARMLVGLLDSFKDQS